MSELWGSVCLPAHTDFASHDLDNLAASEDEFIKDLFDKYQYTPPPFGSDRFHFKNSLVVGDYLCLNAEDEGWPDFCEHVIREGKGEVYASFYDEYGTRRFYAAVDSDNRFSFSFEDESDEEILEDFDEQAYFSKINSNQDKWYDLLNDKLRRAFPPLTQYLQNKRKSNGELNWNAFSLERHSDKLEHLYQDIRAILELLSSGDPERIKTLVSEVTGVPISDDRLEEYTQHFLRKGKDFFIQALNLCLETAPQYYLGRWSYGFKLDGKSGLPEEFHTLVFTLNDEQDEFKFEEGRRIR